VRVLDALVLLRLAHGHRQQVPCLWADVVQPEATGTQMPLRVGRPKHGQCQGEQLPDDAWPGAQVHTFLFNSRFSAGLYALPGLAATVRQVRLRGPQFDPITLTLTLTLTFHFPSP